MDNLACESAALPAAAGTRAVDVFFGGAEAGAARARGLALARGEDVLCDLAAGDRGPGGAAACGGRRLVACVLRPAAPAAPGDAAEGGAEAAAAAALERVAAAVSAEIAPRLARAGECWPAAAELVRALRGAWEAHAAAGRGRLEALVQGACFEAVQGFGRTALLEPHGSDHEAAAFGERAAEWLDELLGGPWCWSPHQRRCLAEMRGLASTIHAGRGGAPPAPERARSQSPEGVAGVSASRVDAVIARRTGRFVLVLEGVRNSSNQQMIFRTCEALGIQELWLVPPPPGARYKAALGVRSRHASRGAERFLTVRRVGSPADVAAACQEEGRELWVSYCPPGGTEEPCRQQRQAERRAGGAPCVPLARGWVPQPLPRLALVLGSEGDGVSEDPQRCLGWPPGRCSSPRSASCSP
ncbi:unnamed protein product [Prorocentrum cordatum]|uniref:tRNA/rRNA methyltransferase SpoU type domain-containing protein n=1 Tax=Prorocentrum cordatum TaxID=2364126 RepID=A0ABN9PH39_9DINO|nr:unnamed protein product [Polarella glacialis]